MNAYTFTGTASAPHDLGDRIRLRDPRREEPVGAGADEELRATQRLSATCARGSRRRGRSRRRCARVDEERHPGLLRGLARGADALGMPLRRRERAAAPDRPRDSRRRRPHRDPTNGLRDRGGSAPVAALERPPVTGIATADARSGESHRARARAAPPARPDIPGSMRSRRSSSPPPGSRRPRRCARSATSQAFGRTRMRPPRCRSRKRRARSIPCRRHGAICTRTPADAKCDPADSDVIVATLTRTGSRD